MLGDPPVVVNSGLRGNRRSCVGDSPAGLPNRRQDGREKAVAFRKEDAKPIAEWKKPEPEGEEPDDKDQSTGTSQDKVVVPRRPSDLPDDVPVPEYYVINGDEPWLENEKRDLKVEAKSLRHQLLHDGFNPHCTICREAKAIRKHNKQRTKVKVPEAFGHVVTCDHVYAHSEELEGITG